MKKVYCLLLIVIPLMVSINVDSKNFESEGNLKKTNELDCIKIDDMKNSYTPADIYGGVSKCLQQERYEDAISLMFVANAYGRYDSFRVADKTAHQAITMLKFNSMSSVGKEKISKAQNEITNLVNRNRTAIREAACKSARKLGRPNYFPNYMIQHGMGAFTSKPKEKIMADFNPDEAWQKVINEYLKCSP